MAWYYYIIIVIAITFLALLFLIAKTASESIIHWEGGIKGFLRAFNYVAHYYALKLGILKTKPLIPLEPYANNIVDKDNAEYNAKWQKRKQKIQEEWRKEQAEGNRRNEENLFHKRGALRINKSIPIKMDNGKEGKRLVIYFEQQYNEPINNYIQTHYDELQIIFDPNKYTFVYFPYVVNHLNESIGYIHPDANIKEDFHFSPEELYRIIADNIVRIPSDLPMLLISDYYNSAGYLEEMLGDFAFSCFYIELEYKDDNQFVNVLMKHAQQLHHDLFKLYQVSTIEGDDIADNSSIDTIAKEIQRHINQLYSMGVSEYVISQIVALPEPQLSTLLITDDYRIILPEYKDLEIPMPTLSKALYFLYLRHPEGLLFKELRDHHRELSEIYRTISPREDMDKIDKSIDDIVDSTKNSVNEKCSRIKAAFVSRFNDRLARNYYITGCAGEPKKIILNRSLVTDNSGIIVR